MDAMTEEKEGVGFPAHFRDDASGSAADPVFGVVYSGWLDGMRAVGNADLGIAQLTDGARVITPYGDGVLTTSRRYLPRAFERQICIGDHRYSLRQTIPGRARLMRDGVAIGWLRRRPSSLLPHHRRQGMRSYRIVRWSEQADRAGALTGHLLAALPTVIGWRR